METVISTDQRIINSLLLNASFIDNLGLMHGKMGISICFFHLARQTGNQIYEDYAGELIDEIYEEITANTPVDFENGLAGIGWGIEYLVQNGFIEAAGNNILNELDNAVFQLDRKKPELFRNYDDFYGYGLYYLRRAKKDVWNTEVLQLVWNDIKELFSRSLQEGIKLRPNYLISLLYFIWEIKKKSYCPPDIDKIIATIPAFISGLCPIDMDSCEIHYLQYILHSLEADFPPLIETLSNISLAFEPSLNESLGQTASYALLFPAIRPFSDCVPGYKDKMHKTVKDAGFREKVLDITGDKEYGICSGVAGYILTILNEGFIDLFRPVTPPTSGIPVYIFKSKSRASEYGIGTYIDELTTGLKERGINITIIHLEAKKQEFAIKNVDGIPNWYIPSPTLSGAPPEKDKFCKMTVTFLQLYVKDIGKIIFHLNSMHYHKFAQNLHKAFDCKILLVIHYMDWSFALHGSRERMKNILARPEKKITDFFENRTLKSFKEDKKTMEYVDHITCVADYSKEIICRDYGIDNNKVTVAHNGLSDKAIPLSSEGRIKLREKYLIGPGEKIILFAGRLDEIKGVLYLIKSFKEIIKYESEVSLWIVGDGAYNPLFKETEGIWNKLRFTGKINREQLFELYAIADIGVVPSLFEPFGYVAVEMMMNSLPVVVTATGGLDEIVEDGVSGLKVGIIREESSVVDTDTLYQKLLHLLQNPEERARLGQNGRSRYLQKFTATIMCEKMMYCYQKLLQPEPKIKSHK